MAFYSDLYSFACSYLALNLGEMGEDELIDCCNNAPFLPVVKSTCQTLVLDMLILWKFYVVSYFMTNAYNLQPAVTMPVHSATK
jgi:hypothetical protein